MNKKESAELTHDMMITDALLRLTVLEKLLISKGIFSKEEFQQEMELIANQLAKSLLKKAGVSGELDEIIKSIKGFPKNTSGN